MTDIQLLPIQTVAVTDIACCNDDFTSAARALLTISVSPPNSKFFSYQAQLPTPATSVADSNDEFTMDVDEEEIFPELPSLHYGITALHVRNGIQRAWDAIDSGHADAEKAFFVADLGEVLRQFERFRECLPGVHPFYAIKCNPDPYVIRLLASLGAGFDCASHGEISQVLEIGNIDPSRIIFANPCKATSFIRNSARVGVHKMTFDNTDELYKISRVHPSAELVIRVLTDDSKSLCRLGLKFGAPLVTVPGLLSKAKELGLNVIGVSFHVGSGSYDSNAFADAVMRARLTFDMGKEVGYNFDFLDVGGGFEDVNFETTANVLSIALDKYFPDRSKLRVIAEPGRFFVSTAFTLSTNIIARRASPSGSDQQERDGVAVSPVTENDPKVMYYINDGVYGSFNCILFDHQVVHPHQLTNGRSFNVPASCPSITASVWGPTCDSIDCVSPSTTLSENLQVDDWLGWKNMGAYTICAASRFNGFETSNVIYTSGVGEDSAKVRNSLRRFASINTV